MPRRTLVLLAAFLIWTLYVWGQRIANALGDDALAGWDLAAPLLLSASFVLPALVLAVAWLVRSRAGRDPRPHPTGARGPLVTATVALAGWTTVVWVVRALDIALTSDRGAAFIAVHVALGVVSIVLAALVSRAVTAAPHLTTERRLSAG